MQIALLCQQCGAPLEVAEETKFVTCGSCGVHLRVRSEGGAHFTEELEELRDAISDARLEARLDTLDYSWESSEENSSPLANRDSD